MIAPPPPQPECCSKEFCFAIFALLFIIAGGVMWGVSKSVFDTCFGNCDQFSYLTDCLDNCKNTYNALKDSGIALLAVGVLALVGVGFSMHHKTQQQQHQLQM